VAVVNEAFVRQRLPDREPLGARLGLGSASGDDAMITIVGVVADGQATPPEDGRPSPGVYLPITQTVPEAFYVMARSSGAVSPLPTFRQATGRLDGHLPWGEVMTLAAVIRRERSDQRLLIGLFGSFGVLALLLAAVGLNGVVSLTASVRTRELGIRRALGASKSLVLRHTVWRGLKPVVVGVVLGSALGLAIVPVFDGEFMSADSSDLLVYVATTALLVGVCVSAVMSPALAAARRNPMQVLRED
jgi:putative ABC transport system permease protein